jgi:hypothetical protein
MTTRSTGRPLARLAALLVAAVVGAGVFAVGSAYGQSRFSDVPPGDVHEAGIQYVDQNGITAGCGDGTRFCPRDSLTRGQMATFLHRQSGKAPGIAPSVNADTLRGLTPDQLRATSGREIVTTTQTATGSTNFATIGCPEGKVAVGGGGLSSSSNWALVDSFPTDAGGWSVFFRAIGEESSHTARVFAVCLPSDG